MPLLSASVASGLRAKGGHDLREARAAAKAELEKCRIVRKVRTNAAKETMLVM